MSGARLLLRRLPPRRRARHSPAPPQRRARRGDQPRTPCGRGRPRLPRHQEFSLALLGVASSCNDLRCVLGATYVLHTDAYFGGRFNARCSRRDLPDHARARRATSGRWCRRRRSPPWTATCGSSPPSRQRRDEAEQAEPGQQGGRGALPGTGNLAGPRACAAEPEPVALPLRQRIEEDVHERWSPYKKLLATAGRNDCADWYRDGGNSRATEPAPGVREA
jgi:hypothetical protein